MNPWPWLILLAAYGACVGSFLNVVIYRLPAGENIITPPSACPNCHHKLAAYDNVPVLGWLWLGGRCRYCKTPISIQYPIIELITAMLFGGLFVIYYMTDLRAPWLGSGLMGTWPVLMVHLVLVASLVGATMIDAQYYIIPLALPRVATVVAVVGLPLAVLALPGAMAVSPSPGPWGWGIESWPGGVGAAAGGALGVGVANLLMAVGLLPRSFDTEPQTYEANDNPDKQTDEAHRDADKGTADTWNPFAGFGRECLFALGLIALGAVVYGFQRIAGLLPDRVEPGGVRFRWQPVIWVMAAVPVVCTAAAILWHTARHRGSQTGEPTTPPAEQESPEDWLAYPHPRREVLKECLFVLWPVIGALAGALWLPIPSGGHSAPMVALAGSACGYLAGAAAIWVTRIVGTLAFGKEAMGLGDVHLLGAIGAVVGWFDVVIVFFLAPFFGLAAALAMAMRSSFLGGPRRTIPYGPYLAAATVVVMIFGGKAILDVFGILPP